MSFLLRSVVVAFACILISVPAQAQLFRAYLALDGSDANPCTLAQPCRLLPAALNAVASGGEVWLLDSANYNTATVSITKSVTIFAVPGVQGSVVGTGGSMGIQVNAPGGRVTLRNLVIVPLVGTTYSHGIVFSGGSQLVVDRCTITGDFGTSILVSGPTNADLHVKDSTISGSGSGIIVGGVAGTRISTNVTDTLIRDVGTGVRVNTGGDLSMERTRIYGRGSDTGSGEGVLAVGMVANAPIAVHVSNSVIKGFVYGVGAGQPSPFVSVSVTGSELSHHSIGVSVSLSGASVALSGSRLVHNSTAVDAIGGGTVFTSGTNYFAYNNSDGSALTGPGGLK